MSDFGANEAIIEIINDQRIVRVESKAQLIMQSLQQLGWAPPTSPGKPSHYVRADVVMQRFGRNLRPKTGGKPAGGYPEQVIYAALKSALGTS